MSNLTNKWGAVLDHKDYAPINDPVRRRITASLLENVATNGGMSPLNEADVPSNVSADFGGPNSNNTTNISGFDPIIVDLVRRVAPNLVSFDLCGTVPMKGPTGLVFALRARYISSAPDSDLRNNTEAFYNEPDSGFSGTGTQAGSSPSILNDASPGTYTYGTGLATLDGEKLGSAQGNPWKEMGFTIEKITVTAKERALKAQYSREMARDYKAVHGGDADAELSQFLQTELSADINREVLRTIYVVAKKGAANTAVAGTYDLDVDTDGRWQAEKNLGLVYQIEREANIIARETRLGKGNVLVASADVVAALSMIPGIFQPNPALGNFTVDQTGNWFAGTLRSGIRVFVDPYSGEGADGTGNYFVVGYKGPSNLQSGLFYCPYTMAQRYDAVDPATLQPVLGFKTRYGIVASPFAGGASAALGALVANSSVFYRRVKVVGLQ